MFKDEITITMQEYKELLIIKGKYEELKRQQELIVYTPHIKSEDYKLPQTILNHHIK